MLIWRYICVLVLVLVSGPVQSAAVSLGTSGQIYHGIATCLGRYAAQVEHAMLTGDDITELDDRRATFQELYNTLDAQTELLSLRITAKNAHAQLLWAATSRDHPRRAQLADVQIQSQIRSCESLLIG